MSELVKDIKTKLGIEGGTFIDAEIESLVSAIKPNQHLEFFMALSGEHSFAKPMDRIANVAKRFSDEKKAELFMGTKELAKSMYDKFYGIYCGMTDYAQANRDKVPNDREFFENYQFQNMKQIDGSKTFTDKEIYVLSELGGGTWLVDIPFHNGSNEVIEQIEKIIKYTIAKKYLHVEQNAITNQSVKKLLRGVKC